MTGPFNPPRPVDPCCCVPPVPQPLPLPQDKYPIEGSTATVTSDGVFKALQDLTQAFGEVLGNLDDLKTIHKTTIVGSINETFLQVVALNARTQHIAQILAAPLAVGPTYLWLGGNCVSGTHSVQVIVDPTTNPQLITGLFNGVFSQYVLPNDWIEVVVRINGVDSLRFYQDPRLKLLDDAYILPPGGIPLADLGPSVVQRLVPTGGTVNQVLTRLAGGAAGWTSLPDFLMNVVTSPTSSVTWSGAGTTLNPLRATVQISTQAGNTLQQLAGGLYVPPAAASAVNTDNTLTVSMSGTGTVTDPIKSNAVVSPTANNLLEVRANGLYVAAPSADGHVMYDQVQTLTGPQQTQARANIGAASTGDIVTLTTAVGTAQTTANQGVTDAAAAHAQANTATTNAAAAQSTANTAITNAATAQSTADSAVSELANKVSRRTDAGTAVYAHTGPTDIAISVSHAYAANNIPRYNAQGTLTGATPTQPDELTPLQYVQNLVADSAAGLYIGAFFFGKTTTSFVPPLPTVASENYFDFPTSSIYKAKSDLTGWDFVETIATPVNGAVVGITSQFWDLALDAGLPGTARWSDITADWDYFPSRFESPPDGQTIVLNVAGQIAVGISSDPDNKLMAKSDGLFVTIDEFNLPDAPTSESTNVLVVDSTGVASWSGTPLTSMNTAIGTAQTTANTAVTNAATAQSTANTAQTNASQALSNAAAAQSDATQALSDAAAAQATANSATTALGNKVDKATVAAGQTNFYSVTGTVQGTVQGSATPVNNSVALRDGSGRLQGNAPVANNDLVNLQYLTTQLGTVNTSISAVQAIANDAYTLAGTANTAAQAAQTDATSALSGLANKVDKLTGVGEYAYTYDGATQGSIAIGQGPSNATIARRTATGTIQANTPVAANDVVTLQYFQNNSAAPPGVVDNTNNGLMTPAMLADLNQAKIDIGNKVDKITTAGLAAYTQNGTTQSRSAIAEPATASTLPIRSTTGTLAVATATASTEAVNKGQMDTALGNKVNTSQLSVTQTPDSVVQRTIEGNVRTGNPINANDAVSLHYYNNNQSLVMIAGLDTKVDKVHPASGVHAYVAVGGGIQDTVEVSQFAPGSTIVRRVAPEGRVVIGDAINANEAVTKGQLDTALTQKRDIITPVVGQASAGYLVYAVSHGIGTPGAIVQTYLDAAQSPPDPPGLVGVKLAMRTTDGRVRTATPGSHYAVDPKDCVNVEYLNTKLAGVTQVEATLSNLQTTLTANPNVWVRVFQ